MGSIFKDLEDQLKAFQLSHKKEYIEIPQWNPTINDFIIKLMNDCTKSTVDELKDIIMFDYQKLFAIIQFGSKEDSGLAYQVLFDTKFLSALIKVLSNKKDICSSDIQFCNRLYISVLQSHNDGMINKLYPFVYTLAKIVNYNMIRTLQGVLTENEAVLVAAARNYSDDMCLCVHNTTFVLQSIKSKTLSVKDLVYIYETIIDRDSYAFNQYFMHTMLDKNAHNNPNIILALLTILEEISTASINYTLLFYTKECLNRRIFNATDIFEKYIYEVDENNSCRTKFPRVSQGIWYIRNNQTNLPLNI